MKPEELSKDTACQKTIQQFRNSPNYHVIKDAFVCNIKTGERDAVTASTSDSIIMNAGRQAQIIEFFRTLESIADFKEPPPEPKKRETGKPDADLAE